MTNTDTWILSFRMSMFGDAFLGSGVPLAGDPITSFQPVPLLRLRSATVLDNSRSMVHDVMKARFIATNCGERRLEIVQRIQDSGERDDDTRRRIRLRCFLVNAWNSPASAHGTHLANISLGWHRRRGAAVKDKPL